MVTIVWCVGAWGNAVRWRAHVFLANAKQLHPRSVGSRAEFLDLMESDVMYGESIHETLRALVTYYGRTVSTRFTRMSIRGLRPY
jgi:hypothetical protein